MTRKEFDRMMKLSLSRGKRPSGHDELRKKSAGRWTFGSSRK